MKITTTGEITGYILVLLATVFYGSAGIFGRLVLQYEPAPLTVTTVRAAIAVCLMLLGFLIFQRDLLRIKKRDIYIFVVYGLIISCSSFFYYSAIKYTTVATAAILMNMNPAIVMILSAVIFRESLTRRKLLALLLTFCGVLLVVQCYNPELLKLNLTGVLFGIAASFCFSLYTLFGKWKVADYKPLTIVFYGLVFATLFLTIFRTPQVLLQVRYPLQGWVWFFLTALIPTILASVCYVGGLNYLEAGKASLVLLFQVVLAPLFAFVVLHEGFEFLQIIGAGLVIWGISFIRPKRDIEESTAD